MNGKGGREEEAKWRENREKHPKRRVEKEALRQGARHTGEKPAHGRSRILCHQEPNRARKLLMPTSRVHFFHLLLTIKDGLCLARAFSPL